MSKKKKDRNKSGKTKTMTEKALAANRANAENSTGPQTPEGKEAVKLNAGKLFLFAADPIAPWENPDDYDAFYAALEAEWQPVGATQRYYFDRMVAQKWRLLRVYQAEVQIMCMAQDQEFLSRERDKLSRYEVRLEGSIRRTRRDLMGLKDRLRERQVETNTPQPAWEPTQIVTHEPEIPEDATEFEITRLQNQAAGPVMPVKQSCKPPANNATERKRRDIARSLGVSVSIRPEVYEPSPPPAVNSTPDLDEDTLAAG